MSIERIGTLVHEMVIADDTLSYPNNCRNSVSKIAGEIKHKFPSASVEYLAYPEANESESVHYSILVTTEGRRMIINTVMSPGFPEYIGSFDLAVPTFSAMKRSDIVK